MFTQKSLAGGDFKRLVLVDSEGTKLTALICGENNIRYFAKLLVQYKRYYVSYALVIDNEVKYRISSYPYSWILSNRILVEECIDPTPAPLACDLEFTKFSDLYKYADTDSLQNVKAVVLKCFPSKEKTVVAHFVTLKIIKTCWIKGKISFPKQERSLWYTACASCKKSLEADVTWIVTCPSCGQESEVQAMSRIEIQMDDGTANIHAVVYTPQVEKIIPFTALQLKQSEEDGIDLHDEIAMAIQEHTIVAFLRTFEFAFNRQSEMKITIVQAYITPQLLMSLSAAAQPSNTDVSVTDAPNSKGEEQLFTSSTKLILEEINTAALSKSVKRSLPFTKEDINPEANPATNKPQNPVAHIKKESASHVKDGSPTKKNKAR